jgi:hypothetical protein
MENISAKSEKLSIFKNEKLVEYNAILLSMKHVVNILSTFYNT